MKTTGCRSSNKSTLVCQAADRKRFHGAIKLDPVRVSRDFDTIAHEVIQHLSGLIGAEVDITLEAALATQMSFVGNLGQAAIPRL